MSSVVILFCVFFICLVFAPMGVGWVMDQTGWQGYVGIIGVCVWAAVHDIRTRVSRNVMRKISKDPDLYMDL